MIAEMPPPPNSPADVWEDESPSRHRCAICHTPFTRANPAQPEYRPTGLGGRLQRWSLCPKCIAPTEESMESRAARRRREFDDAFLELRTTKFEGFEHLRKGRPDRKTLRDMARKRAKQLRKGNTA